MTATAKTTRTTLKRDTYFDSVALMTVASAIDRLPGIAAASLVMGTALNRELLHDNGLATPETDAAGPNDLIIAVRATDADTAEAALREAEARLIRPASSGTGPATRRPRTLPAALETQPGSNLAVVSVPGPFAALEAEEALRAGLHVLLFSDNVPLREEVRLKRLARERGVLLMGPDCGTAIVNGAGLGFANVVRRGPIGVIGASGTGMQQVTCLIDHFGSGVSQALGAGGRDLHAEVGGLAMLSAIAALGANEQTQAIVLISKPPAAEVIQRIVNAAVRTGKPTVAVFLGYTGPVPASTQIRFVRTLTDAARQAVVLAGRPQDAGAPPSWQHATPEHHQRGVTRARAGLRPEQRYLRGLFSGGTLCDEALLVLGDRLAPLYSNIPLDSRWTLPDARQSQEHTLVDLGADEFTVGRPHPMIDPTLRNERLEREAADPQTACLLLDVVLGYGAHPDPAGALAPVLNGIRDRAEQVGHTLPVIVSLCGTEGDPQRFSAQEQVLREAGALVYESNAAAAEAAGAVVIGR